MSIGENIQKLRKQNGLSQEELSEKLFVTRQTISKWELGQSSPDLDYIVKLSEIFNVTTDFLIKGEDNKSAPAVKSNKSVFEKNPLGVCLTIGGLIGIFVFIILSIVYPCSTIINSRDYTDLLGFLFGRRVTAVFLVLLEGVIFGIALLITDMPRFNSEKVFQVFKVKYKFKEFVLSVISLISGFVLFPLNFFLWGNHFNFLYSGDLVIILALILFPIILFFIKKRE